MKEENYRTSLVTHVRPVSCCLVLLKHRVKVWWWDILIWARKQISERELVLHIGGSDTERVWVYRAVSQKMVDELHYGKYRIQCFWRMYWLLLVKLWPSFLNLTLTTLINWRGQKNPVDYLFLVQSKVGHAKYPGDKILRQIWKVTAVCFTADQHKPVWLCQGTNKERKSLPQHLRFHAWGRATVTLPHLGIKVWQRIHILLSTYSPCYLFEQIFTQNFLVPEFRSGKGGSHEIIRWRNFTSVQCLTVLTKQLKFDMIHARMVATLNVSHCPSGIICNLELGGQKEKYMLKPHFHFPHL